MNLNSPRTSLISLQAKKKPKSVGLGRPKKIKAPEPNLAQSLILSQGGVVLTLPIRTVSEGNCFEPWQKKHKRHKAQKLRIRLAMLSLKKNITLPCKIKLTRYAPRTLDKHDNLPMSFKFITDALCEELTGNYIAGQADSDDQISISYDQEKTKDYGIKIEISF